MSDSAGQPVTMLTLFGLALAREASDLHLKVDQPAILRVHGVLENADMPPLGAAQVLALVEEIMDERVRRQFDRLGSADFAYMLESGDRFRVNVYRDRGFAALAARRVNRHVPSFQELHLPERIMHLVCEANEGLVVFSGVRGCGKSTSIAACLDYINSTRRCHIVTVEDPIEFLFTDKQAVIHQREIGTDVPSFASALKYLARQDPDVVLVGEMRDRDTCESVLRAAEASRLVFTSLHATSAPAIIMRLLEFFPAEDRPVIREIVASNLVAAVCQKLLPGADPNVPRVPATEVMLMTPTIRKMIREGQEAGLSGILAADTDYGMHDFTRDLARLVREEWVDPKVAYEVAPNPEALKMAIRGIAVKQGTLR